MIKLNNVKKIYDRKTPQEVIALEDISFQINKGELVNIIGRSGSGKTTLLKLLLGIIKPTDGEYEINGIEINRKTKKKKLRKITDSLLMSFQYPTHQLFTKSVEEELLFNNGNKEKLEEIIELFGFDKKLLDRSPFRLSSGQKRKVILMSLLMQEPEIIIFDEPTAFLDAASRREFVETIKKVNEKYNTTMLFVSHNLTDVSNFSNRTILLDNGKIIDDGITDEVIKKYTGGDLNGK